MTDSIANDPPAVLRVRDPCDVVAVVPYLLGYWPSESLVVIALRESKRFGPTLRIDLPHDSRCPAGVDEIAAMMAGQDVHRVLVVAISGDVDVAAPFVEAAMRALRRVGITVEHAVGADGIRWWCLSCAPVRCTPREGRTYDPTSMRVCAEAVAAGLYAAPSRDASREVFSAGDPDSSLVTYEIQKLARTAAEQSAAGHGERVDHIVRRWLAGGQTLDPAEIAVLAVGVADVPVRDGAWALMERRDARIHLDLWSKVVRCVPERWVPGPGTLAGFAAWLSGNGTLARHAVERVLTVDADYSMALLLAEALDRFLDPAVWDDGARR